jgi:hypothetical protein
MQMSPQYNYLLFYYCIVYLLFINCYYLLYVILFVCYLLLLLICCIYCYLCCFVYLLLWYDGNRTHSGQGEDVHTSIFRQWSLVVFFEWGLSGCVAGWPA